VADDIHVSIQSDVDIVAARQKGRALAASIGFSATDMTLIATAISELARNIVFYAKQGEIILRMIDGPGAAGMMIISRDDGPGIRNVRDALRDGFSTSGGLGLGLPGVKRLMDEFDIHTEVGQGTTVSVKKWRR